MRYRRTTLITASCLAILAGLGLSRKISLDLDWWLILFAPILLLLRAKNHISLVVAILLGLSFGMWRGGIYMERLAELKALSSRNVTIQVTAKTDAVYGKKSQIEFTASDIQLLEPQSQPLAGSAKISGFGVPMVYRGDRVQVSGKLYPMRGSNQARIAYAQLKIVGIGNSWFDRLTRTFSTGMENALPEPHASFGLGLLVGQRTNLPADIVNQLTMVGLVHIVAVSGYNLTILVRSTQRLKLRSKYQRTLLSLGLIISFILVTGFSASIVRAAVVSILSLWAWYYGRNIKPVLIIIFAAALTALFNPFYIWSDIGWYLSFLAFFGVLVIAPLIVQHFFRKTPQILTLVLIETLSAEIMTLPLIMMVFGQMSLVALLANLLVVPLIPAAMLLSAIAAAAGAAIPQFAGWFALPARLLLTYILDLIHMLSSIPRVFIHLTINPTLMISLYVLVIALVAILHKRLKNKPGTNTLEVVK
jgi:competence protein ComEC